MKDIYRFGTAAVTVASFLKGVLEIAGTDSFYPDVLRYAGAVMLVCGAAGFFFVRHRDRQRTENRDRIQKQMKDVIRPPPGHMRAKKDTERMRGREDAFSSVSVFFFSAGSVVSLHRAGIRQFVCRPSG